MQQRFKLINPNIPYDIYFIYITARTEPFKLYLTIFNFSSKLKEIHSFQPGIILFRSITPGSGSGEEEVPQ